MIVTVVTDNVLRWAVLFLHFSRFLCFIYSPFVYFEIFYFFLYFTGQLALFSCIQYFDSLVEHQDGLQKPAHAVAKANLTWSNSKEVG